MGALNFEEDGMGFWAQGIRDRDGGKQAVEALQVRDLCAHARGLGLFVKDLNQNSGG